MPNYNINTKQWTYTVEEQSKYGLDEEGRDLIYMDDEENNFGEDYEYGSEEESDEGEDGEESSTTSVVTHRKKSQRRRKNPTDEDFDSDFYKEMEENQKQIHASHKTSQSNLKKEILTLLKKF